MHFSINPYLDPGSGSFIIQILIAAILGLGVAVRVFWSKIKGWFGKKQNTEDDENGDNG